MACVIRCAYRYQACRQARARRTRTGTCRPPKDLSNTRHPTKRVLVRSACKWPPVFGPMRFLAHQRGTGRRKLPRTVRVSYRLNRLPALPPHDAGVARKGAALLDAHFPSAMRSLAVLDSSSTDRCASYPRCRRIAPFFFTQMRPKRPYERSALPTTTSRGPCAARRPHSRHQAGRLFVPDQRCARSQVFDARHAVLPMRRSSRCARRPDLPNERSARPTTTSCGSVQHVDFTFGISPAAPIP